MITAGIDIGSTTTKIILLENENIIYQDICLTGNSPKLSAEGIIENALHKTGLSLKDIDSIVSTGYGRRAINYGQKVVSEITACAKGIKFLSTLSPKTIVDLGGQDTKVISLDEKSDVMDFVMNDKCAAGCGKFLEVIAGRLNVRVEDLAGISEKSKETITINSTCTVFAETEVISLLAQNKKIEDIVYGILSSITERIITMIRSLGIRPPLFFCGGGAKNKAIHKLLKEKLNQEVYLPNIDPQYVVALGAAMMHY